MNNKGLGIYVEAMDHGIGPGGSRPAIAPTSRSLRTAKTSSSPTPQKSISTARGGGPTARRTTRSFRASLPPATRRSRARWPTIGSPTMGYSSRTGSPSAPRTRLPGSLPPGRSDCPVSSPGTAASSPPSVTQEGWSRSNARYPRPRARADTPVRFDRRRAKRPRHVARPAPGVGRRRPASSPSGTRRPSTSSAKVYPDGLPRFAGDGLTVVRYAEAKLAAAEVLDAIRVNLPDLGDAPDQLRASALGSLRDGVDRLPARVLVGRRRSRGHLDDVGGPARLVVHAPVGVPRPLRGRTRRRGRLAVRPVAAGSYAGSSRCCRPVREGDRRRRRTPGPARRVEVGPPGHDRRRDPRRLEGRAGPGCRASSRRSRRRSTTSPP